MNCGTPVLCDHVDSCLFSRCLCSHGHVIADSHIVIVVNNTLYLCFVVVVVVVVVVVRFIHPSGLRRRFSLTLQSRVGFLGDSCTAWVVCELALVHCGVRTPTSFYPATRSPSTAPTSLHTATRVCWFIHRSRCRCAFLLLLLSL